MSGVSKPHFFRAEQIIHHSQRSTIYRARDVCTGHPVVVKRSDRVVGEMSNILGAMRSGCQLTQRPYIREPFSAARLDGGSDRVGSGLMIALEEYEPVDEAEWTRERGDEETLELMRPFSERSPSFTSKRAWFTATSSLPISCPTRRAITSY